MRKVMLIIRDGWGYTEKENGNAILHARTPFDNWLNSSSAQTLLACSGESVGLPRGFQGSSEVGHLNMGAGRIVEQEVTRIFNAIKNRDLFKTNQFGEILARLKREKPALHFLGLLQDEGVHAHQEHLFELYKSIRSDFPNLTIWIHPIADGRDTPPQSFLSFFSNLESLILRDKNTKIGTVWGRYYGMDRSRKWDLVNVAVNAIVRAMGQKTDNFALSVRRAYQEEKTPDNVPMYDEYIKPLINETYSGMKPGDIIINFNYRQDRAIQISQAFNDPECPIYVNKNQSYVYYGLTRYYDEFKKYLMPPMDDSGNMNQILGEILSNHKKRQLRIAETQKFRHVTSFFNGKNTKPYDLEDQIEIPSQWDPSAFASHPEMNAENVTQELLSLISDNYDFIVVNYANCDMVGHTGDFNATVEAVECVDNNVQLVTAEALRQNYHVIVTADHGNAEEMFDENGNPKTAHTTNPVKLHLVSPDGQKAWKIFSEKGILSDVSPMILKLMELPIPVEMTSRNLEMALK